MEGKRTASLMAIAIALTSVCLVGPMDISQGIGPVEYHNSKLHVNVSLPGGSPAVGLMVTLVNYYYRYDYSDPFGYTNGTGVATFELEPENWGPLEAKVMDAHWKTVAKGRTFIEPGSLHYLDLVTEGPMANLSKVSGTVTNSSNGQKLNGIDISLQTYDHLGNPIYRYATTGPNGKYEIDFPNITGQVYLFASSPSHFGPSTSFSADSGTTSYTVDITLSPSPTLPRTVRVKYTNTTSGRAIIEGSVHYSGYYSGMDHTQTGMNSFSPDAEGWYNVEIGPGEFLVTFMTNSDPLNYTIRIETPLFVNGSDISMEIPFAVPGVKLLEVNIWNSTSPLRWATVGSEEVSMVDGTKVTLKGSSYTDASGRCYLGIRDDRPTELKFYGWGHREKTVTVDPDTVPLAINVTLEEYGTSTEEVGTILITPIDKVTGYRVPGMIRAFTPYSSNSYGTNETGVFEGELRAQFYTSIEAFTSLGYGSVNNVTIIKGSNPDLVIEITRVEPREQTASRYTFYTVDLGGSPVPNVPLVVSVQEPSNYISIVSDGNGKVEFYSGAGEVWVMVQEMDGWDRTDWAVRGDLRTEVDGTGGNLPNVTVYTATPLDAVYGFVKDALTDEVLQFTQVIGQSYWMSSDHVGHMPSGRSEDVLLFYMSSISDGRGFYRVWGRDEVFISASKEGYFPSYERFNVQPTRADVKKDILLYPLPEFDIFVNGTLIDGEGDPVQGYVRPKDNDHDGYSPNYYNTEADGSFSIPLYRGNFTLEFGNGTVTDFLDLKVTGTIDDLVLILVPKSDLVITLVNWSGEEVPGIEVQLELKEGTGHVPYKTGVSSPEGIVWFRVPQGTYRAVIRRSLLYDPLTSDTIEIDGWTDRDITFKLGNRTTSDLSGMVTGEGGIYFSGIPWTKVALRSLSDQPVKEATTDRNGAYSMVEVPFGTYNLVAEPPENLSFIENESAGYIPFGPEEIVLNVPYPVKDLSLVYRMLPAVDYINVTDWDPKGTDVALNAPIIIRFSKSVDRDSIAGSIVIEPDIAGGEPSYLEDDTVLRIDHEPFAPNTTYNVKVLGTLLSVEGYPMGNSMGFEWNFTTGSRMAIWEVYSAVVGVLSDKRVEASVMALEGIDIFIVISGVGSFGLIEGTAGEYTVSIAGTNFEWNTTYSYHFSNASGGIDLAPDLKSTFTTPALPWGITWANVDIDDDMNWDVQVKGTPDSTIYIVIEGVGSFKLNEDTPGNFSVRIDGDEFKRGKSYDYHFSDRSDGPDMAPAFSGSEKMPEEKTPWILYIGCCLAIVMLIVLVLVLVLVMRRKKDREFEE